MLSNNWLLLDSPVVPDLSFFQGMSIENFDCQTDRTQSKLIELIDRIDRTRSRIDRSNPIEYLHVFLVDWFRLSSIRSIDQFDRLIDQFDWFRLNPIGSIDHFDRVRSSLIGSISSIFLILCPAVCLQIS